MSDTPFVALSKLRAQQPSSIRETRALEAISRDGRGTVAGGSARVIVVLGDIPATGHFANAEALRGPVLTSTEEAAPDFLELVAMSLPVMSEGILVVYPQWQAKPAKRLIRVTRGMLDTDQVASIGLDLPPLACSVVADLLSFAAPHLQIGYLAGLARRLQDELLAGARLATVAKLEHIGTKLTQHMASYSPGSGFLAWAAPEGRIDRVSKRRPLASGDFRPADPLHLLVAPHGSDFPEFEKELSASLRPQLVKKVDAQPLGATFWGTRKHVEFVAFSGHPQALSNIVRSTRYWMCRWCRQPASLEVCAICGMFQEEAGAAPSSPVPEAVPVGASAGPAVSPGAGHRGVASGLGLPAPVPQIFLTAQPAPAAPAAPPAPAGPDVAIPRVAPQRVAVGHTAEFAPSASGQSTAPSTAQSIARPGPALTPDDERAIPFGKGAPGNGPAASGGRPSGHPSATQAEGHPPEDPPSADSP